MRNTVIVSDSIKKYDKLLLSLYSKSNNDLENSIFLDFDKSEIYFQTERYQGKFKFEYEGDKVEGFFVDIMKFRTLINTYPKIMWDSEKEIFINPDNSNEQFNIPIFKEGFNIEWGVQIEESPISILEINKIILEHLKYSPLFINNDVYGVYNGVYLGNNKFVATNRYKFYEANIEFDSELFLHSDLIKLIIMNSDSFESISVKNYENFILLDFNNGILQIVGTKHVNVELPPLNSPEFIQSYNHETNVVCNRLELINVLNFLEVFNKEYVNQRIFINFISENSMLIEVNESNNIVKRELPILSISPQLIGLRFGISLPFLKTVLNTFKTENVKIQLDKEKPALNFTEISDTDNPVIKRHIVIVRLEDY